MDRAAVVGLLERRRPVLRASGRDVRRSAVLGRLGYPASEAAYAVNALYQVACFALVTLIAAIVTSRRDARALGWICSCCRSHSCSAPLLEPLSPLLCRVNLQPFVQQRGSVRALWQCFRQTWREYQPGTLVDLDRLWKFFLATPWAQRYDAACLEQFWQQMATANFAPVHHSRRYAEANAPTIVLSCALWWQGQDSHKGAQSMPVRITRVYTRTGDDGTTALVGGVRVPKDSRRIAAYGTIDELNASLGLARVFNEERLAEGEGHQWLDDVLRRLQNELFDLGSELATPEDAVYEGMFRFSEQEVKALERLMDQCQKGTGTAQILHFAWRWTDWWILAPVPDDMPAAEREILALSREETINPCTLKYVNRLSDVFFVLSRWVGKRLGEKEYLWERGLQPRPRTKRARS